MVLWETSGWEYTADQAIREFKDFPFEEAIKRLNKRRILYPKADVIIGIVSVEASEDTPIVTLIAYCRHHNDIKSEMRKCSPSSIWELIAVGDALAVNYKREAHPTEKTNWLP